MTRFIFTIIAIFSLISNVSCSSETDFTPMERKNNTDYSFKEFQLINCLTDFTDGILQPVLSRAPEKQDTVNRQPIETVVNADCNGAIEGFEEGFSIGSTLNPKSGFELGLIGALIKGTMYSLNAAANNNCNGYSVILKNNVNQITVSGEIYDPTFIYKSYLYSKSKELTEKDLFIKTTSVNDPDYSSHQEVGTNHNLTIETVFLKENIVNSIHKTEISPEDPANILLSDPQFIESYKIAVKKTLNGNYSIDNKFSELQNKIMTQYQRAISGNMDNSANIGTIVEFFANEIYNSKVLTQQECNELYSGMAVMANSAILWSNAK